MSVCLYICVYIYGSSSEHQLYIFKYLIRVSLQSCSSTIREKIIPHAVSWFTGEAIEGEEFDIDNDDEDDIDENEDDDEEDDEDEDEDEEDDDDEDEEEVSKTKKKVFYSSFLSK